MQDTAHPTRVNLLIAALNVLRTKGNSATTAENLRMSHAAKPMPFDARRILRGGFQTVFNG